MNGNSGDVEMAEDGYDAERVVILDAGAQYGKVIDRRVRELCVETEILPINTSTDELQRKGFRAIIISGGPGSVNDPSAQSLHNKDILRMGLPVLGICYGFQFINFEEGGIIGQAPIREDGQFSIDVDTSSELFSGLSKSETVLLTHADHIEKVADGYKVTATCGNIISAIACPERKIYGVQFHPEVDLTLNGTTIFKNFLFKICGLSGKYTVQERELTCIEEIQKAMGRDQKALALLSGGVDSTVCAALLHKAVGADRVIAIHIDNGFLRKNESSQVLQSLEKIGLKVKFVNASHTFYHGTRETVVPRGDHNVRQTVGPLHRLSAPEEKRKIIGDTFVKVVDNVMKELNLDPKSTLLVQGTLRPDLIESASSLASGKADAIKTHHNDSEMVRQLRKEGRVIEPLKDFHKDEVRALGAGLGLPEEILQRHPFPGPGLAIRVICAKEPYRSKDFSETSTLLGFIVNYSSALKKPHPLLGRIQQNLSSQEVENLKAMTAQGHFGSVLLPIKSVGVQGDCRTYSYVAALSSDQPPDWTSLFIFARIVPKLCHNINRVVYVFGDKVKEQVMDVTNTFLTEPVLSTLRQVDCVANATLVEHGVMKNISQMPIVLVPIHFDRDPVMRQPSCQRSVVIRTFLTNDFMTGVPAVPGKQLPEEVIFKMVDRIKAVPGISRVMYDLTSKPPGTTEWE